MSKLMQEDTDNTLSMKALRRKLTAEHGVDMEDGEWRQWFKTTFGEIEDELAAEAQQKNQEPEEEDVVEEDEEEVKEEDDGIDDYDERDTSRPVPNTSRPEPAEAPRDVPSNVENVVSDLDDSFSVDDDAMYMGEPTRSSAKSATTTVFG